MTDCTAGRIKLYEAKIKARQEVKVVLERYHVTVEQVKDYVAKHPKYDDPMRKIPHHHSVQFHRHGGATHREKVAIQESRAV